MQDPTTPTEAWIGFSSNHSRCHGGSMDVSSSPQRDNNNEEDILSRPILVGYAFGPKKMSTMGVVMAEASKTNLLSSLTTTILVEEDEEDEDDLTNDDVHDIEHPALSIQQPTIPLPSTSDMNGTTSAELEILNEGQGSSHNCHTKLAPSPRRKSNDNKGNIMLSLDSYSGGLKNIVRYLHSTCSSIDTNSTTTTLLTMGTTGVTPSTGSASGRFGGASISGNSSTGGNHESHQQQQHQRLRVSFVPLDPDFPLEDQHSAKVDVILHKLTEDILCLSQYVPLYPSLLASLKETSGRLEQTLQGLSIHLPQDAQSAIMRVHRLVEYQKNHPECWLADDPTKVLTLMSRSEIANALTGCLVGVRSTSGIPVSTPKFVVWDQARVGSNDDIIACLQQTELSYPLIAKPLQAAGTKTSHYMSVLLHTSSLEHVQESPCLLQEYANHDSVLYKVYVLGNNVRVYQRPSLPNLPPLDSSEYGDGPDYVDFDSQRPYPRLSAFGVQDAVQSSQASASSPAVTAEEVQPIVDTLKRAFGLELFGFDILITSPSYSKSSTGSKMAERRMLVVDVNYFPSYKEMQNFPSLLAQHLTQRAINRQRHEQEQHNGLEAPSHE